MIENNSYISIVYNIYEATKDGLYTVVHDHWYVYIDVNRNAQTRLILFKAVQVVGTCWISGSSIIRSEHIYIWIFPFKKIKI